MSADKQTTRNRTRKPRSDFQRLSRRFMAGLLKSLFLINKPVRQDQLGFVLPTTVLLLLVMTLTVGALTFRTASRTQSTYLAREQQVIDNIAAPAVDRAKAKLEYLFTKDVRMPGSGAPSSDVLAVLMLDKTDSTLGITKTVKDPYTLPDEERLDINRDGNPDNAWSFSLDTGDVVAYSLLMDDAIDPAYAVDDKGKLIGGTATPERNNDIKIEDTTALGTKNKANNLIARNGPINTDESLSACGGGREPEQGWLPISTAALEKNFQITAFVSSGQGEGRTNSALELQQVRRASKGNRWGAWFKYDIELNPGANFNWNGAMHTEGSMFAANKFHAHMISSHNSCLYSDEASEITLAEIDNNGDDTISITDGDFQGQMVSGTPAFGENKNNKAIVHIFNGLGKAPKITVDDGAKLTLDKDSLDGKDYKDLLKVQLDPVALFTQNVSKHRGTDWKRSSNWAKSAMAQDRVKNESQEAPYLDDFYRADNRYGPVPEYDGYNWVSETTKKLGEEILDSDPNSNNLINETSGLDGYWERQALSKGLRVVVGQRLELGNKLGWNFNAATNKVVQNADPLYPPDAIIKNKQRQRVTLRDNLSAVQGMVVYHYQSDGGEYPLACVASTAHPGTRETLVNSRNFTKESFKSSTGDIDLISNFLTGKGTNGWEYDFPAKFKDTATAGTSTLSDYSFSQSLAKDRPLGIALRNLAHFAGDPKGGSPSFTPEQSDGFVHPYPQMAMWGDYSILRRIFDERLDSTTWNASLSISERYKKLSPADKSSLHSAACTMGLLGQNLSSLSDIDLIKSNEAAGGTKQGPAKGVGSKIWQAFIGSSKLTDKYCKADTTDPNNFICEANPTKEEMLAVVKAAGVTLDANELYIIDSVSDFTQVERDRKYGFAQAPEYTPPSPFTSSWSAKATKGKKGVYSFKFPDSCHPGSPNSFINAVFQPKSINENSANARDAAGLALVCATQPKYAALHYLFPLTDHDHNDGQPPLEGYINSKYIFDESSTDDVNDGYTYKVVGDDNKDGVDDAGEQGMKAIAFDYRTTWKLPRTDTTTSASGSLNPETMEIIDIDGSLDTVPLLDKVMYNGREGMAVRTLDIDLAKLTQTKNGTGDYWVPDDQEAVSGIFYAAREDALREDSITRPVVGSGSSKTKWDECKTLGNLLGESKCWMDLSKSAPTDPPLSARSDGSLVGISAKPVDFAPDPDRRPYGFRLNAHLKDTAGNDNQGDLSNKATRSWGFTFITDNAAYIRGEFNPHTKTGAATDTLEEFDETLYDKKVSFGADFYNKRKTYNTDEFATKSTDRWRVTEVLADAVTLLSENFVDGAVQEGFIRSRDEVSTEFKNKANAASSTSFHNQQRPLNASHNKWGGASDWLRVDGSNDATLPIWVGKNGESQLANGTEVFTDATDEAKFELPKEQDGEAKGIIDAKVPARMNATIIAGLVPSRDKQYYGGLHNFPRFLEDWNDDNLFIQGAFLQLNFSTASTGPFDVDAWEPGDTPESKERILYYKPPSRRWGYDVGLQYATAGPIAQRFVTLERPRSEHYRELPIEDPYVENLRCAKVKNASGSWVDQFDKEICPS